MPIFIKPLSAKSSALSRKEGQLVLSCFWNQLRCIAIFSLSYFWINCEKNFTTVTRE
jgi:hypothetical protein